MEDKDIDILERILVGREEPRNLPFRILKTITDGFSEARKIGMGGFGAVYKGVLPNGSIVAVKRMFLNIHTVDDSKFIGEITSQLKIINHPNVVRFLGFCSSTNIEKVTTIGSQPIILAQRRERLLCFEYINNGSLDKHITDELRGLEWNTRFEIIRGICEGLHYLHEEKSIIHMDLKPENIMVNSYMVPKITDFGLSRPGEKSYTTGDRFGSWGYCAPEYNNNGITTLKCDIYSLGVIINDLVTGRKGTQDINNVLRRWRHRWSKLPRLTPQDQQVNTYQVVKCMEIAKRCMDNEPNGRPSISVIKRCLDEIGSMMNCHISGQISPSLDDVMLGIMPLELHFSLGLNKKISCEVELTNGTSNCIAFNIVTPSLYCTKPNKGIVRPWSKRVVEITLQAQETTVGEQHPHEFSVRSTKVEEGLQDEHITKCMFINNEVDEVNLMVVYDENEKPQGDTSLEPLAKTKVLVSMDSNASTSCYQDTRGQYTTHLNFNPPQMVLATNLNYQYKAQNQGAIDLVAGAMAYLIPKLDQLFKQGHNMLGSMKKRDYDFLQRQLLRMKASLHKVSLAQQDQLNPQDRQWADEVRELSYDIEDIIDDLLPQLKEGSQTFINTTEDHDGFEDLKEAIEDIMVRVKEMVPWKVSDPVATMKSVIDPRLLAFFNDNERLVGISGPQDQLTQRLIGGEGGISKWKLKIISIFGPGGVGKTTLAKAVYDRLCVEFFLKAFVRVGRNPDMKIVLERILLKLDKEKYGDIHNKRWEIDDLIDELQQLLDNKRYLIVIDDIWDITSWDVIKCALIDNGRGSRIITTSRIFEVAEKCGECCELKPLSDYHSKELFYARLSGGKGPYTFDLPDEQSTKILQKCGGVPLAIITIASLLANKSSEDWPKVYNSIGFGLEDNRVVENTRKILLFSYYDLPCYLKTCLLYMSTFSEEHDIEKDTLVWKWISEGFVCGEQETALFKVGESYFNELINRSMIQPVLAESDSYTICACRLHDMVLDMICSVAKEENFVTILEGDDDPNLPPVRNVRRLAVHKRAVTPPDLDNTGMSKSEVRSFNANSCGFIMTPLLSSFKLLRVLSLQNCTFVKVGKNSLKGCAFDSTWWLSDDEEETEDEAGAPSWSSFLQWQLSEEPPYLLRYLGLCGTRIGELPMEIGNLRFLQTLDLRDSGVEELPRSLIQLTQLKCLRSEDRDRKFPDGMGNLTSLEDLRLNGVLNSPNFCTELANLTELRVLHITMTYFSISLIEALLKSLSKLQKIEELKIVDDVCTDEPDWDNVSPSPRLCNLHLYKVWALPQWINPSVLRNLTKLLVSVDYAKAQDLDILGSFPELRYLCLFDNGWKIFPAIVAAGAFPRLLYCHMDFPSTYLPGAMPCLESIELTVKVSTLEKANFDFNYDSLRNLPLLKKVRATVGRWCVNVEEVEKAEAAVRHAVSIHPNHPILVFEHTGLCDDECLSGSSYDSANTDICDEENQDVLESDFVDSEEEFEIETPLTQAP